VQLKPISKPLNAPDPEPNKYLSYGEHKQYVVNGDDEHFEIKHRKAWDWTLELTFNTAVDFNKDRDGEQTSERIDYGVLVCVGKLNRDYGGYCREPVGTQALKVTVGEFAGGVLVPWKTVLVSNLDLVKMIKAENWRVTTLGSDHEPEPVLSTEIPVGWKYTFGEQDGRLSVLNKGKEHTWTHLANFMIDGVLNIYQSVEREKYPVWWRLSVRAEINETGRDLYVSPEEPVRAKDYSDVRFIEGNVLVPVHDKTLTDHTLGNYFSDVCPYFETDGCFKRDHLKCLVLQMKPVPDVTIAISNFGRQKGEDTFVFGNCCFRQGELLTHEQANVTVLPRLFSGENAVAQIPQDEFPTLAIIPEEWVRYALFVRMWTEVMPAQFLNNEMPAKCAFALSLSHLHCSKFWAGGGVGDGVGTGWEKSTTPGTGARTLRGYPEATLTPPPSAGKTEALLLINSMHGFDRKGLTMGACSSMPLVSKRLSTQRDLSLCLDEIATKSEVKHEQSKKIKDLVHMVYNGSSREVCGKTDKPLTTFIGSANILVVRIQCCINSRAC
jgi:hypothetical protein